jgi:hypothetical protein
LLDQFAKEKGTGRDVPGIHAVLIISMLEIIKKYCRVGIAGKVEGHNKGRITLSDWLTFEVGSLYYGGSIL